MKSTESDEPRSECGRCSSCSKEATNRCAGCVDAPAYGKSTPRTTFYCSGQCQKAHWSAHKVECKALQTRKSLHRVAAVLAPVRDVIGVEGKQAMVRLAAFAAEIFDGLNVTVEEVILTTTSDTTDTSGLSKTRHVYKVTINDDETWVLDLDGPFPPWPWSDYIRRGCLKVDSIHSLGFHRRAVSVLDPITRALVFQVASMVTAHGGKLGAFLKGSKATFQDETNRLVEEIRGAMTAVKAAAKNITLSASNDNGQPLNAPSHAPSQSPATGLYRIQAVPGKGQGMVATSKIPRGTRILSEAPAITTPGGLEHQIGRFQTIISRQLDKLDDQTRHRFYALHNNYEGVFPPIAGIFKTNALPLGHKASEGGIFLEASRINHSCKNNAENTWNKTLGKLTIHAVRDIQPGEEITISYVDAFKSYDERQHHLQTGFGFSCDCERCSASPAERRHSDQRLRRLATLEKEVGDGVGIVATPLSCLWKTREMLRLLREEVMTESCFPRVYFDAFQVAIANGDQARARVFAERCYASRVVVEGDDNEDSRWVKSLVEKPSSHRLYGTTMKWKQAAKKVPCDLGEEEFESWLWKDTPW
ncbi:SET domain-containing protein 5 [Echria macrotheca]|uniref:SET domain-containing protein 5 n=1 Tax=Echria macrotheca TaxID=438768 RepID=A0AAJ0F3X9_9PEZI|nr:SET domain-containing protein 5 [Echria macrotheca]